MSEIEPIRYIKNLPTEVQSRLFERIKQKREQEATTQMAISPRSKDIRMPALSFPQQRLWFMEQLLAGCPSYNVPVAVLLEGALQISVFEQCVAEVVNRHEVLRTTFLEHKGQPVQVIAPTLQFTMVVIDMQGLKESELQYEMQCLIDQEATLPFNLAHGPLLRVTLLQQMDLRHVLLITMHHIISDGWSLEVLIQELTMLYAAFMRRLPSPLPALPVQYADYALWQREWQQGEALGRQLAYWREKLQDVPTMQVPTDYPRPKVQRFRGGKISFQLSKHLSEQLLQLSHQEGATLYMTLLTAFNVLLWRYSGQEDLVVGMPVANRTHRELEALIGFFVNMLVLRTQPSGELSYRKFLHHVKKSVVEAQMHQNLAFEYLVEQLQPKRSLSHNPFFQIVCTLLNAPPAKLESVGLTFTPMHSETTTAKFDLSLLLTETSAGITGSWEYNTDLFKEETVRHMHIHWQRILEKMVANPEQQLDQLFFLSETEEKRLLFDWNATQLDFAVPHCLPLLVEQQVERTPDAVAAIFEESALTYLALDRRANVLAHTLCSHGVGPDQLVGICLSRSLEMIIALLAILKAGGAYVPLDPTYPRERLRLMIQNVSLSLMLTQSDWREMLESLVPMVLVVDASDEPNGSEATFPPARSLHPEHLAYVIYTSGSTGMPKGVMISHRGICNRLFWAQQIYHMEAQESILHKSPLTFDISIEELFWPLMVGAHTVIARPEGHRDSEYLVQTIMREQISILRLVTPQLTVLVETAGLEDCQTLRLLICGGETLLREVVQRFYARLPRTGVVLYNFYGATEASVDSTFWECEVNEERGVVPIGRPMANVAMYVLDEHLRLVPVGVIGNLYIGGISLARGYLGQSALTAERFVPNPYGQSIGERLYKTGDRGRYLSTGVLDFAGRKDNQVKLRGYRIELGEIEASLREYPEVKDVVVVVREDIPGDQRLVAYIVRDPVLSSSTKMLRTMLRERLPEYMVPSSLVELETFPLTSNGKVDRRVLPAPSATSTEWEETYVAPRTPIEELLLEMWTEVLGIERISMHDDFFALGGHSLLATQVISRIQEAFQIKLPLHALFATPTIADIADEIQNAQRERGGYTFPLLQYHTYENLLPLSPTQQGLWLLEKLEPGNHFYTIPIALHIGGRLDFPAFVKSLNEIVCRHEVLRTTFTEVERQPVQMIHGHLALVAPLIDLQGWYGETRQSEVQRLIREEARQPFDLQSGPLLRVTILRVDAQEHMFLLNMHHIITDGSSMGVLAQELKALYIANLEKQPASLPKLPAQYADFVLWQREWLKGEVLESQLSYWKQQLSHLPTLNFPTDRQRPARLHHWGATQSFVVVEELRQVYTKLAIKESATLFMAFLAVFHVLLSHYCGQNDIVVGTTMSNRPKAEFNELIGFFVNTLVLRTQIAENFSFYDLLRQVRKTCLEAYSHQDLPFAKLVTELKLERDLSRNPLFQIGFTWQQRVFEDLEIPGLQLHTYEIDNTTTKFDLGINMFVSKQSLIGSIEYSTELFDETTITRLIGHFQTLLESIAIDPNQKLSMLPLLKREERERILTTWNATQQWELLDKPVVSDLFAQQAAFTPDTVALVSQEQHLSYRQLDNRANQLAHALQLRGVGPEVRVGLCLPSSLELIISVLAIIKAGGAYVPLDANLPSKRLLFLVQDAQIELVISTRLLVQSVLAPLASTAQYLCLDSEWSWLEQQPQQAPHRAIHPAQLAYILYTSGSTGRPKGVMITQAGLRNYVLWACQYYGFAQGRGAVLHSSMGFDLTVTSLFCPLLVGRLVQLVKSALGIDELVQVLQQQGDWSVLKVTPVHLRLLQERLSPEQVRQASRVLIVGGEALSTEQVKDWRRQAPTCRIVNEYGPTETVVGCCIYEVGGEEREEKMVPIGHPIANMRLYIVDKYGELVPIGVEGELVIAGEGIGRGYQQRADLTAEQFVPDSWSGQEGARCYRSGDRAHYRADGTVEYLGRQDEQIKVRGFRIELGEIEAVLSLHPAVRMCAVNASEDVLGDKHLVSYVVLEKLHTLTAIAIRQYLSDQLPQYMVPLRVVFLDALPLSINNKVDRKALPVPDEEQVSLLASPVASHKSIETILVHVWQRLLESEVGIHDNFFTLGGDSILALQMVPLAAQMGLTMKSSSLFQYQTIAQLSKVVSLKEMSKVDQKIVVGPVPLTPIQHWFFEERLRAPQYFVLAFFLQAQRRLSPGLLARTLDALLLHHDALRLSFTHTEKGWQQYNQEMTVHNVFSYINLSSLRSDSLNTELARITTQFQTSLNLQNSPLLRLCLLDFGAQKPQQVFCFVHHLLLDVVSQHILIEDLQIAYMQISQGQEVRLPAKTSSYQQWAHFLTTYAYSDQLTHELPYWHGRPYTKVKLLPIDKENGDAPIGQEQQILKVLETEETQMLLQTIPLTHNIQIHEVLLTALVLTLSRWTGQYTVLIDLEGHGREDLSSEIDVSRTIGWFTSIFPLCLELRAGMTLGDVLLAVKEQIRSIPQRGIGYGLLRYLREDALLKILPQAEINFNYLGQSNHVFTSSNLFTPILDSNDPPESPAYRLSITAQVIQNQLHIHWRYRNQQYHQSTITRLVEDYLATIHALLDCCRTTAISSYTPSDFPDITVNQEELNDILTLIDTSKGVGDE